MGDVYAPIEIAGHQMPGLWQYLLPEPAAWQHWPAERLARCDPCYMAALGECRDDCRCCTYFPQVPNFAVGLALHDPEARPAMLPLVKAGSALPQGLLATPERFREEATAQAEDQFGQLPALACPFLQTPDYACAIYPYRNSVCSTFFCAHDHGDAGEDLWGRIQLLMGHLELTVSQWAMGTVGLDPKEYFEKLDRIREIDGLSEGEVWSEAVLDLVWGSWRGREVDFFEACADAVLSRRETLYTLACAQPLREARRFEAAVRDWIPEASRVAVPPVSELPPSRIEDLWYKLQVATRNLWALPFGEGRVVLAPAVVIAPSPRDTPAARFVDAPWRVSLGEEELWLCDAEIELLRLFDEPVQLGERLFERPEIAAVDDVRDRLAEWMRRGVLIPV